MFNKDDLREYRLMSGLTYRDVARYCEISFQTIQDVERGETKITDRIRQEIIKGINGAKQAIASGTFASDKKKEAEENKKKRTPAVEGSPGKTTK